jgi:hypothetical protein
MLTVIDRVQIATLDAAAAAEKWRRLLGAEDVSRDSVRAFSARRLTLRAGASDIELLEPDGAGTLADELKRRGRAQHFSAGASSPDAAKVAAHARAKGASHIEENGQHHLSIVIEGAPIRFVISSDAVREPVGDLDFLYEATILAADEAKAVGQIRDTFALDEKTFTTISSDAFGYTGTLTLFREGALHRFEVITPHDREKTMGRYYAREGASYYMAFGESARMARIEREARAADAGLTIDRPERRAAGRTADQLWLHPPSLGGMMLGVSRPSMAWRWSGHSERVSAID